MNGEKMKIEGPKKKTKTILGIIGSVCMFLAVVFGLMIHFTTKSDQTPFEDSIFYTTS
jgi:hypothetical protein